MTQGDLQNDDLQVDLTSTCLLNRHIEVVVSGSIAAVESVRFVRALRRLGARVSVLLTSGGKQFVTPTALEWASGAKVFSDFSGTESHLAQADACVVAPCSANLIAKIAHGITDSAASAKITSYLGSGRPVMLLPTMHDSLLRAPATQANIRTVSDWAEVIGTREEEGKQKFPDPMLLADEVAHRLTRRQTGQHVLITMGSTRGYIDDVRFVTNYSTGATGTAVAQELYRNGYRTHVICGPTQVRPALATDFVSVQTHGEMAEAIDRAFKDHLLDAGVFAASVLDYQPAEKISGKVSSKGAELVVRLVPTSKLLARAPKQMAAKIAFKLEVDRSEAEMDQFASQYATAYGLSMVVGNLLKGAPAAQRRASIYSFVDSFASKMDVHGNRAIADAIAQHVQQRLARQFV
jgi:phosphopantothenoylcysteine decarboxylase/phosphopantothenate--cysteine ligase